MYSPTGHLLFIRTDRAGSQRGTIYSVSFDLKSGRVTSSPIPRVSDVAIDSPYPSGGRAHFSVGNDGTIYYVPYDPSSTEKELLWLDRRGHVAPASPHLASYGTVSLSWDGKHVAYSDTVSIWVGDLARDSWIEVAQGDFVQAPLWSADDSTITYEASNSGEYAIWTVPADGSKPSTVLLKEPQARLIPSSRSHEGGWLTLQKFKARTSQGTWAFNVQSRSMIQILPGPAMSRSVIAPNGRSVMYRGPTESIQVQSFPALGPRTTILNTPPCPPAISCGPYGWFRDSNALFYVDQKSIVTVPVTWTNGKAAVGQPETILDRSGLDPMISVQDVAPDGRSFLAVRQKNTPRYDHINILSGWWTQ